MRLGRSGQRGRRTFEVLKVVEFEALEGELIEKTIACELIEKRIDLYVELEEELELFEIALCFRATRTWEFIDCS